MFFRTGACLLAVCLFASAAPAEPPAGRMLDELPANWQPVEQPDLAEKLKAAPPLKVTDLVVNLDKDVPDEQKQLDGPTRVWNENPFYAVNPDGSWDVLVVYQNGYLGHKDVVIHDYGTGETTVQQLRTGKGDALQTARYSFHIRQRFMTNGRLFINAGSNEAAVAVYDPAENRFTDLLIPFGNAVEQGRYCLGDDGNLYGIGWTKAKDAFVCFKVDTATKEITRIGDVACANPHRREMYMHSAMSGDWIYAAAGARPWQLVGFNVKTGQGRVLAETKPIIGDYKTVTITEVPGGIAAQAKEVATLADVQGYDPAQVGFWLHDGKVVLRNGPVPPWSDKPVERERSRFRLKEADPPTDFQVQPKKYPPELDEESITPDADGVVTLRYRKSKTAAWETFTATVKRYAGVCRRIMEVDDHRIFAKDEGYGQGVLFNLDTGSVYRNGDLAGVSTYSMNVFRGKMYCSGYPSSRIWEIDLDRIAPDGTALPDAAGKDTPIAREIAVVGEHSGVHVPFATNGGADGRLYTSGTTVERRRTGGGMGWVDLATHETGGLWKPFSAYRTFWSCAALDHRYIVWSGKPCEDALKQGYTPEVGRLFIWDTQKEDFSALVESPGGVAGPLAEVAPGYVIGHASKALYGLDVAAGKVLWTKPMPVGPVTSLAERRRHRFGYRMGPDRNLWTFLDDVLVRIDPRNAEVTVVGRIAKDPGAVQLAFAKGSIYLAGGGRLLRVEGVTVNAE